jgi:hypothetical protein
MIDDHVFTPNERGVCIYAVKWEGRNIPCGKMRGLHARKEGEA